jgi:DnaJ-class molecular chaperone
MHGAASFWFLLALIVAGRWLWHAWFHPMTRCRKCGGSGRNPGSTGMRWGRCRRCKGQGSRQVRGSKRLHKVVRSARNRKD